MSDSSHSQNTAPTIYTVDICIVHDSSVLMLKRSAEKKVFPNCLAFPGGHIEQGEDPMAAALREAREETGLSVDSRDIQLKFIAMHEHIDRQETYMVFGFLAVLKNKPSDIRSNDEGTLLWVDKKTLLTSSDVFPPVQYYCDHILNKSGILYNSSVWEHSKLLSIKSEHTDSNS